VTAIKIDVPHTGAVAQWPRPGAVASYPVSEAPRRCIREIRPHAERPNLGSAVVRRDRGFFELAIHLIEQLLGLGGVTAHVKFIGALRRGDFLVRLRREPLRGGEIRMASATDVVHGWGSDCHGDGTKQSGAEEQFPDHGDLQMCVKDLQCLPSGGGSVVLAAQWGKIHHTNTNGRRVPAAGLAAGDRSARNMLVEVRRTEGGHRMRTSRSGSLTLAAALFLCTGTAVPVNSDAALSTDACSLLTAAQVSSVLGTAVEAGEHVVPNSVTSCGWMGPEGPSIGSKKMVLSLMSARAFEVGKTPVKGVTEIRAPGIGDEAYYISMPPFGTALSVRKGSAYFQLRIAGFPSGQVRTLERALALRLLERV
jgi:hypothetical protein